MAIDHFETDGRGPDGRGSAVWGVVLAATLTSVITVTALQLGWSNEGGHEGVAVPELVGMPVPQAREVAQAAGLLLHLMGRTFDPVVAEGRIARQTPLAGGTAAEGTRIVVTVSQGPGPVAVPPLRGVTIQQATDRLKQMGLVVGAQRARPGEEVAPGRVVSSDPGAGAQVARGTVIDLAVAGGSIASSETRPAPEPRPPVRERRRMGGALTAVPKVTGMRLRFASHRLGARGLVVGSITYQRDEDHIESFVLGQSPAAGSEVSRGTRVDLVVNRVD